MKKVLSLVLAVVLTFGMASVAFAAGTGDNKDNKINLKSESQEVFLSIGASTSSNNFMSFYDMGDSVKPGKELEIPLSNNAFVYPNGTAQNLTTSKMSSGNYSVKRKVTKGSDLIDSIELKNYSNNGGVYVKVEFIEPFVSTKEKDFDFTLYLAHKSSRKSATELQITGTLENDEILVDEDDDEVDLSDNAYAKADAYIKAIKIDTGNGLFVNTKMFDGQKYYAQSTQEISAADDAVISKYPEIDTVYTLYSVNMSSAGNTVEFDIDDTYYVYDATGKYIGTTADKLPMSSKYYMATTKIDMTGSAVEEEPGEGTDVPTDGNTENAGTGGDDVPANVNDNPGTGANGFVNVAVVAGLVAAAAAVSLKK